MSNYTNKDQQMLEESLDEILEEGLWDRMKARGSQAVGAARGAGQQLKGVGQRAAGSAASKVASAGAKAFGGDVDKSALAQRGQQMRQAGDDNVEAGGNQANNAKIDSFKKSVEGNVESFLTDLQNDMSKLGIQLDNIQYKNFAKGLKTSVLKSLDSLKQ